jgi:hypothetical protein
MPTDDADRLYGLPLDEFTAARNDLVRHLRAEGRREKAAEVAALRKPTVAAWVVNRLAREQRAAMRRLLQAADGLKAGRAGADERFRAAADELARAARRVLETEGRPASDGVLDDVATTLRVAAAEDPNTLAAGRLTREMAASGFSAALAGPPRSPPPPRQRERPARPRVARVAEARAALAEAKADARRLGRQADEAERTAERARDAAAAAVERVEEAERRLAEAREPA